jgi:hypothetical protein
MEQQTITEHQTITKQQMVTWVPAISVDIHVQKVLFSCLNLLPPCSLSSQGDNVFSLVLETTVSVEDGGTFVVD